MIVDIVQSDDSSSNSNSNDIGEKTPGFYGTEGGSYFFANSLAIQSFQKDPTACSYYYAVVDRKQKLKDAINIL